MPSSTPSPTIAATPEPAGRRARIAAVEAGRQRGVLVLEDVVDPHNARAAFRSCEALGFSRVCLIFHRETPFDPYAIGASTKTQVTRWLNITVHRSPVLACERLRDEGYELLATTCDPAAPSLYTADLTRRVPAVLLGNEHRGLSPLALALADRVLTLPLRGLTQSLNLSVTASILLYEITRQRTAAG